MAIREIVTFPDDRLRRPTAAVTEFDEKLKELIQDMFDTMYDDDGIGLAAPQIGVSKKIVVMDVPESEEETAEGREPAAVEHHPLVLINPVITEKSGSIESKEGCLSVPEYYETVRRAETVSVKAQDADGNEVEYKNVTGLLAVCMQHELDHLEGRLFIDYLSGIKRDRLKKQIQRMKKAQKAEGKYNGK